MIPEIVYLDKDQIDWDFINIREKHGYQSLELWHSLKTHGQLQPGAGWWQSNGKFRILYGHRRAVVLTTHGERFMAIIVPEEDEINTLEKQLVENEQRLRLNPGEEENAIRMLRDYYGDEDVVAKRIGRSKAWIRLRIRANQNRNSISQVLGRNVDRKIVLSQDELNAVPTSIIDRTMDVGLEAIDRAEILAIASKEKGGITTKNVITAIHKKRIKDAGINELKIDLANKEAELSILFAEKRKMEEKILELTSEIYELRMKLCI